MSKDMEDQAVYDINVDVTAVLGTASLLVNQLLKLGRGAVVELGQNVGDRSACGLTIALSDAARSLSSKTAWPSPSRR